MRSFYKLALLLGCINFVNIQGYTAQSAIDVHVRDFRAGQSQLAKLLSDTFKDDQSASPLADAPDHNSRLADMVVGHMRAGNDEQLNRLFYQPDIGAWSVFYRQITGQQFSTVGLIDLLDQTKSKIFTAYSGKIVGDKDAYFYIPTLLDQLIQKIFTERWGFSDEPTPDDVIDRLKGVYGRVVSGLATVHEYYPLHIIKSLEAQKEQSSPTEAAHFTAPQECAAAVYSHLRSVPKSAPYSVDDFKKSTNVSFSTPSFEITLRQIHYKNPLETIVCDRTNFRTLAWSLINPEWNPIKNRQDVLERVKAALNKEFGAAEDVELTSEQFDPFHFSTVVKLKGGVGLKKIVWSTQKPDCSVEICHLGDAPSGVFGYSSNKFFVWQSTDKKWHFERFNGTSIDRWLGPIYPEGEYVEWLSFTSKVGAFEFKAKNPF